MDKGEKGCPGSTQGVWGEVPAANAVYVQAFVISSERYTPSDEIAFIGG